MCLNPLPPPSGTSCKATYTADGSDPNVAAIKELRTALARLPRQVQALVNRLNGVTRRADGVTVELEGGSYNQVGGRPREIPHDLAHLVVEDELGVWAGSRRWAALGVGESLNLEGTDSR